MSAEDFVVWPDGTYCFAEDLPDYSFMSDDYIILAFDTPEWNEFYLQEFGGPFE